MNRPTFWTITLGISATLVGMAFLAPMTYIWIMGLMGIALTITLTGMAMSFWLDGSFFGWWMANDVFKGGCQLVGVILTALISLSDDNS